MADNKKNANPKKKDATVPIAFRVPPEVKAALEREMALGRAQGKKNGEFITMLYETYLASQPEEAEDPLFAGERKIIRQGLQLIEQKFFTVLKTATEVHWQAEEVRHKAEASVAAAKKVHSEEKALLTAKIDQLEKKAETACRRVSELEASLADRQRAIEALEEKTAVVGRERDRYKVDAKGLEDARAAVRTLERENAALKDQVRDMKHKTDLLAQRADYEAQIAAERKANQPPAEGGGKNETPH